MGSHASASGWTLFFGLAALEAGAALIVLLLIPHEGSGFSAARLAVLGLLFVFMLLSVYFAWRPMSQFQQLISPGYSLASALLFLTLGWALFFLRYLNPERFLSYYQRLAPLLFYLLLLALQFSLFTLTLRFGFHRENFLGRRPIYPTALIFFSTLIAAL